MITWRKYYKVQNISFQDGATKLGMKKKTLDDYFLQIKQGKLYGFDFEHNSNNKIGVLRAFVKKMRENDKKEEEKKPGC